MRRHEIGLKLPHNANLLVYMLSKSSEAFSAAYLRIGRLVIEFTVRAPKCGNCALLHPPAAALGSRAERFCIYEQLDLEVL